jgi:hypothetical protein
MVRKVRTVRIVGGDVWFASAGFKFSRRPESRPELTGAVFSLLIPVPVVNFV